MVNYTIVSRILGFWISQETCPHENFKSQKKRANITGVHYFCAYQQVESTFIFVLYLLFVSLPHYLHQLYFFPQPPPLTECAANDRLRRPLSSGGNAKLYDHISPRQPNEADMTTTTYPVTVGLSANHLAYGG